MNITILGAAGKTGQQAVEYALSQGHTVTALVRNTEKLRSRKGLTVIQGDATLKEDVIRASDGADAIVSTLGSTKGGLMVKAIEAVINASETTGVKKFVLMSSVLARREQIAGFQSFLSKKLLGSMVEDKLASEKLLISSDLDYAIVFATILHNKETGKKVVEMKMDEKASPKNKISRKNAAIWLVNTAVQGSAAAKETMITEV